MTWPETIAGAGALIVVALAALAVRRGRHPHRRHRITIVWDRDDEDTST